MNESSIEEALRILLGCRFSYQVLGADEPIICESYPCAIIQNTGTVLINYIEKCNDLGLSF